MILGNMEQILTNQLDNKEIYRYYTFLKKCRFFLETCLLHVLSARFGGEFKNNTKIGNRFIGF